MSAAKWGFKQMGRADMNADPVQDEFFSTEAIDSLAAALVRESGQNSLDARANGEVRIRVVFGTAAWALPAADAAPYLQSLKEHVQAEESGIAAGDVPSFDQPMPFVAIEDFGTRGLQGNPEEVDPEDAGGEKRPHDFYYFWRNLGRSKKGEADRGRWGLGHSVFANASGLRSFFGLTVRRDDGRTLLMGQSILKIHRTAGTKYFPYGWFGVVNHDDFVTPVEEAAATKLFRDQFRLNREAGPGLSIVIPFPDESITVQGVAQAFIRHYFAPLIRGVLSVELESPSGVIRLSKDTLRDVAAEQFKGGVLENLLKMFDLVAWSQSAAAVAVKHDPLPSNKAPVWEQIKFADADRIELTRRYEEKERLAVEFSPWVKEKGKPYQTGAFRVYLERDPLLEKGEIHFIRQDITVANPKVSAERSVRALVIIDDKALAQLLGDAENPAHTEWQDRSEKFKNKYDHGPYTLRFVKNSAANLIRTLTAASQEKDRDLLKDLFFVVQPSEDGKDGEGTGPLTGKGRKTGPVKPVPPPKSPPPVRLEKVAGGFSVSINPAAPHKPRQVKIRLGYAVRNGNPITRYDPADFQIDSGDFTLDANAAEIVARAGNELVVNLNDPASAVRLTGFDQERDLQIRLTQAEGEQS